MKKLYCTFVGLLLLTSPLFAGDWPQFRGPTGQGISNEKGLPTEWSSQKNIAWKLKLPGAGASSPIVVGKRVFVTAYSGYGLDSKMPGNMDDLKRHLLCIDRANGNVVWTKEFAPLLPEHNYKGEGAYHGYAASTPIVEGDRLYVFFGKTGVFCFDLDGKQLWHSSVGNKIHGGWGSGASPMLYKNLLIVNASAESGSLVALNKADGKEVWRAPKISSAWGMPILVTTPEKQTELAVSVQGRVAGFDPDTGKELWSANGHGGYVCPSVVTHDGVVYAVGGGGTSLAVKSGGRGDVTKTHVLWRMKKGSNASSPIYHAGNLYWASEGGGVIHCQEAATGKSTERRPMPDAGRIWASPILVDGKLYFVSQFKGTYVVAADPKLELLAHNTLEDSARSNASLAVSDGQLFLRNDSYLYCIGKR
jgi:outer membrane protein assembly factor BamB